MLVTISVFYWPFHPVGDNRVLEYSYSLPRSNGVAIYP